MLLSTAWRVALVDVPCLVWDGARRVLWVALTVVATGLGLLVLNLAVAYYLYRRKRHRPVAPPTSAKFIGLSSSSSQACLVGQPPTCTNPWAIYPPIPPLQFTLAEPEWANEDEALLSFTDRWILPETQAQWQAFLDTYSPAYSYQGANTPLGHIPLMTGEEYSNRVNFNLHVNSILDLVVRDFVRSWFHAISTDGRFPHTVRTVITQILRRLVARADDVDLAGILTHRIVPILTIHLRQFRLAERRARKAWSTRTGNKSASRRRSGILSGAGRSRVLSVKGKVPSDPKLRRRDSRIHGSARQGSTKPHSHSESWFAPAEHKSEWDQLVYRHYDRRYLHPALVQSSFQDTVATNPMPTSSHQSTPAKNASATMPNQLASPVWTSPQVSLAYLRHTAKRVLPLLCLPAMLESKLQATVIRELMVGALMKPICLLLTDPDTWNQQLSQYLTKAIEEQDMVNQLREALNEQSQPLHLFPSDATSLASHRGSAALDSDTTDRISSQVDQGRLAAVAAKLHGVASHALASAPGPRALLSTPWSHHAPTFEQYIENIKVCNDLDELKATRNQIVAQIRTKRVLVKDKAKGDIIHGERVKDIHVYINRLFLAKKLTEKRILQLGREVYRKDRYSSYFLTSPSGTTRPADAATAPHFGSEAKVSGPGPYPGGPHLKFLEVLTNPAALSYFTEYMDLIGKIFNLQFWLAVEGLKRNPDILKDTQLGGILRSIYRTYFSADTVEELNITDSMHRKLVQQYQAYNAAHVLTAQRSSISLTRSSFQPHEERQPLMDDFRARSTRAPTQEQRRAQELAQAQKLLELILKAQREVFVYMRRHYFPVFLRSGLYFRFLTSYSSTDKAMSPPTAAGPSSVAVPLPAGTSWTHESPDASARSSFDHRSSMLLAPMGLTDATGDRRRSPHHSMEPSLLSEPLGHLRVAPTMPHRGQASTSLTTTTVTIHAAKSLANVQETVAHATADTSSLVDSVVSPTLLPAKTRRRASTVGTTASLPVPSSNRSLELYGMGPAHAIEVSDIPPASSYSSDGLDLVSVADGLEPMDIQESDLLATGAVDAVEAALSTIMQNRTTKLTAPPKRRSRQPTHSATKPTQGAETLDQGNPALPGANSHPASPSHPTTYDPLQPQGLSLMASSLLSNRWWPRPSSPTPATQPSGATGSLEHPTAETKESMDLAKGSSFMANLLARLPPLARPGRATAPMSPSEGVSGADDASKFTDGPDVLNPAAISSLSPSSSSSELAHDSSDEGAAALADSVHYAPPGDLLLSGKIAKLTQDLDTKQQQSAIVAELIDRAKRLDKWHEMRILQKSQNVLTREIQLLVFQKEQYERQEQENAIMPGRTRITIPSCTRGFNKVTAKSPVSVHCQTGTVGATEDSDAWNPGPRRLVRSPPVHTNLDTLDGIESPQFSGESNQFTIAGPVSLLPTVGASPSNASSFALYLIEVQQMAADGTYNSGWVVARRYREFTILHQHLREKFPVMHGYELPRKHALPTLPELWPMSAGKKAHPWPPRVESRRSALEQYLQAITQHYEVCHSFELRQFLSQQQQELSHGDPKPPAPPPATQEPLAASSAESDPGPKNSMGSRQSKGSLSSVESLKWARQQLGGEPHGGRPPRSMPTQTSATPNHRTENSLQSGALLSLPGLAPSSSSSAASVTLGQLDRPNLPGAALPLTSKAALPNHYLNPIQKTIAEGLEDILGGSFMLGLVSQQLGQQVTNLALEPAIGPGHTVEPAGDGTHAVAPFMGTLCDLLIEVFELKEKNNWLRKQAISMLLRNILGSTIERRIREGLGDLVALPQLTQYLQVLKQSLWPQLNAPSILLAKNGSSGRDDAPRSDAAKFDTRYDAYQKWQFFLPNVLGNAVGTRNAKRGAARLFNLLQNPYLNENIMYFILDEMIGALFPELKQQSTSLTLSTRSTARAPSPTAS
ncbi:tRNA (guanine-N(7)-)-methyltransferase (tRNA(m7G46)-methyltransferase) [Dimargaris verticillata]|uniref:tRNA (Guanine-N(7)-)-methyltransferase (tRNA(m7G46)-methyltransferase) n=1 Tax=Dimargaris verticillata TaxID=2761393 RepID=A0A9W8EDL0_9FUNG|nr:tRNA (guanine-N(7)-)-methyltransferase (tRNA(m7G46)-methyltransferase) [Dimargaris verticillata]